MALARLQENPAVLEGYEALQRLCILTEPWPSAASTGVQAFDEALMPGPDGEDQLLEHGADRRR